MSLTEICDTLAGWLVAPPSQPPAWSITEWESVRFASRVHGIVPLLYEVLREQPWLDVQTRRWLAEQYQYNERRVVKMQQELTAILTRLAVHNLPVMPLKGSVLAATVYQNPAHRPMADLDLLVRPQDFEQAASHLKQLGYAQNVAHWKHTGFCQPDNRHVVSNQVEHPDNPRQVELHPHCRESFGGPTLDLTELMWSNSTEGELLGVTCVLPKAEMLWLHVLVHATYHLWQGRGRLIHLVDLAKVAPTLTEPEVYLNGIGARFTTPALALCNRYFPGSIDPDLLNRQQARVSPRYQQWIDGLNLVNTSYLNPQPPGPYLLRALKFAEGRPQEVAQALRFALLPSLDEIALDHPKLVQSKAPWLAYFLLPVDWGTRFFDKPKANRLKRKA